MNQYRIEVGLDANGKPVHVIVKAGDMQLDGSCLVFRKSIGTSQLIATFKSWNNAMRTAVDVSHD